MPVNWTIKGESGQGWNDSVNSLQAKNISSAKVNFKSLDADELTFSILVEDITSESYTATPTVTPDSSVIIGTPISVTVSCETAGATLHYTTNGTNPTTASPTVANGGVLSIANPSTLKVLAVKVGLLDSDIKVAEYKLQGVVATGGTTSDAGGFRTHTFLASDSLVVTNGGTIEYLVVAGGGSGGGNSSTRSGGGGGAGGFKTGSISVTPGTYAVTVGAGGMALTPQTSASDGGGSSIGTLVTTTGGGAGASVSGTTAVAGRAGGSGGGGTCGGVGGVGNLGSAGQGNNGGASGTSGSATSGTGGGSAAVGVARTAIIADGGAGTASSITGTAVTYSVGGGVRDPSLTTGSTIDSSVVPNTGRGGAGAFLKSTTVRIGANGSSGIVVVKYALVQPSSPSNIDSLASNLPTLRQEITLYRDGVSFFFGNVTNIRSMISSGSHEHQVTVSGPWWFLEKVAFTSTLQSSSGNSGERISYVFGSPSLGQQLKTSIEQAIDRANQIGCPIASISGGSSVAVMHTFPRITLNQSTCGQVIAELVRLVPDAMTYFDYATYPAKLKVVRRSTCATITFDQDISPITSIDINPIIELEAQQVELPSISRDSTGRTIYNIQSSGSSQSGKNITKRQVITISGPELDTFLPNDLFETQTISTSSQFVNYAHDSDSLCVQVAAKYGYSRLPISINSSYQSLSDKRQAGPFASQPNGNYTNIFIGGYSIQRTSNNEYLTGYKIITSQDPADWTGVVVVDATISGQMWHIHNFDNGHATTFYPIPPWLGEAQFTRALTGYSGTSQFAASQAISVKSFKFNAKVTNGVDGSTTVTKPADYSFINPPTGLAGFLLSTQNWTPYEGSIQLEQDDVGAVRYVGSKINIINSLSAFSTMGALVSGESLEIETGRTTISLGAPPRNDYRTLVDKIRKTSQDNIVYI